jgi:hypothetical protein
MLGLDVEHSGRVKVGFAVTAGRALSAGAAASHTCP